MKHQFIVDMYRTEIEKTLGVWSMFNDEDLFVRPNPSDHRGRNLLEHMVHQCVSEHFWFTTMLDIDVAESSLPRTETRIGFIRTYHRDATARLRALEAKPGRWWSEIGPFFDEWRSHAWIVVRRMTHTAHHRGQQTTLLRILNRELHSTYGPTADTGGLMQNQAPVIYPYPNASTLIREESSGRDKIPLPRGVPKAVTERPENAVLSWGGRPRPSGHKKI